MNSIDNSRKSLAKAASALKSSATSGGYAAHRTGSSHHARVQELTRSFDAAITLFQDALPGFGLKLVVPPPLENGHRSRISISAWRRGDASARIHAGAKASDVLMQLLASKADEDREMQSRRDCLQCRGLGWYIAEGGAKAVCAHPKAQV